jgi:hypothetical protein
VADKHYARLHAAATLVRSAVRALDAAPAQGYATEQLVEASRKLADVVDALNVQESTGSSGSVLPA